MPMSGPMAAAIDIETNQRDEYRAIFETRPENLGGTTRGENPRAVSGI